MNRDSIGAQIVGGIVVFGLGVLTIGAIFQLNKPNTPLVPSATSVTNTALGDIFK